MFKGKYVIPSGLLIVVILITTSTYFALIKFVETNSRATFDIYAQDRFDALQLEVDLSQQVLQSIQSLYYVFNEINQSEFRKFAKKLLLTKSANPGT
jgi:CHASE1-domain containing sensor protein